MAAGGVSGLMMFPSPPKKLNALRSDVDFPKRKGNNIIPFLIITGDWQKI